MYGITFDQYTKILLDQNGVCAICKKPESYIDNRSKKPRQLSVDHCHKTGKVRALLCYRCNQGIGVFEENIEILKSAIDYILYYQ